MSKSFSMTDLRKSVSQVYFEELQRSETGVISNADVIDRVKKEFSEQVVALSDQLISRQINKMIHDSRASIAIQETGGGPDLFGEFPHVKRSVSVRKGETKALENVTVEEFRRILQRQEDRAEKRLENYDLRRLWNLLETFIKAETDTVAELFKRRDAG